MIVEGPVSNKSQTSLNKSRTRLEQVPDKSQTCSGLPKTCLGLAATCLRLTRACEKTQKCGRERGMSDRHATIESPVATKALEEVRHIVLDALSEKNAQVYLFGSWARGEATRLSDIDVAIDPHVPLPRGTLARL